MITQQDLDKWSEQVDRELPASCPKCQKEMQQIRYVGDRDTTTVRLTGAGWSVEVMRAKCPHCDHTLLSKQTTGMERF